MTVPESGPALSANPKVRPATDPLTELDLVVFDKDGTLIDFDAMWAGWMTRLAERLEAATGATIAGRLYRAMGFDPRSGRARPHGPLAAMPMARIRDLTLDLLREGGATPAEGEAVLDSAWQAPDPVALARPLTDLPALFATLHDRGLGVAVATSDDRAPTEATFAALGIGPLVDALVCADDGLPVKPAPDMVGHLCRMLGVEPSRAAMIGDSPADLAMGRAAGVARCIGVLSGVGTRPELEPLSDVVIDSIADLLPA